MISEMPDDLLLDDSASSTTSLDGNTSKLSITSPEKVPVDGRGSHDDDHNNYGNGCSNYDDSHCSYDNGHGNYGDEEAFYNHQVVEEDQLPVSPVKLAQPLPQPHPPQPAIQPTRTVQQLEILYQARGRQMEELSQQLLAVKEDSARHVKILRDKVVSVGCMLRFQVALAEGVEAKVCIHNLWLAISTKQGKGD